MTLKGIDTHYLGYWFRSLNEARYARYWEILAVANPPFEYEVQGYQIGKGYLPDFWLPWAECYIEIKSMPLPAKDSEAVTKLAELVRLSKKRGFLFAGDPLHQYELLGSHTWAFTLETREYLDPRENRFRSGTFVTPSRGWMFLECWSCNSIKVTKLGTDCFDCLEKRGIERSFDITERLKAAAGAARRFRPDKGGRQGDRF